MYNLTYKVISIDKSFSDNSFASQKTTAEKQNLIAACAALGATHIECTFIADRDANLISAGNTPSPRNMATEIQEWINLIHAQDNVYGSSVFGGKLKIVDRHIWCGMQNISGFAFDKTTPVGTAASAPTDGYTTWLGRDYDFWMNRGLASLWQTGDIICPVAEITGTAFGGNFWTDQSGAITYCNQAKILVENIAPGGVSVVYMSNPNFSEVASGWWSGYGSQNNIVCSDYYLQRRGSAYNKPEDVIYDWQQIYLGKDPAGGGNNSAGGYDQVWMEYGDLANAIPGASQLSPELWTQFLIRLFKLMRDNLVPPNGHMIGFAWWGGWDGQDTALFYKTGSGASSQYFPNFHGLLLASFFKNNGGTIRRPVTTIGTFNDGLGGRNLRY